MNNKQMWNEIFNPFQMIRGEIKIVYHNNNGEQYTLIYTMKTKKWFVVEHKTDKRSYTWSSNTKIPLRRRQLLVAKALRRLQREWEIIKKGEIEK